MLSEKIDRVETRLDKRIDCLEHKLDIVAAQGSRTADKVDKLESRIDTIAADISAHRADTEAHSKIYKVKEAES